MTKVILLKRKLFLVCFAGKKKKKINSSLVPSPWAGLASWHCQTAGGEGAGRGTAPAVPASVGHLWGKRGWSQRAAFPFGLLF